MYDEILQFLVHCKNGVNVLRSFSSHDKIQIKMVMCLGREMFHYIGWKYTVGMPGWNSSNLACPRLEHVGAGNEGHV
jgi:hypothetical protein